VAKEALLEKFGVEWERTSSPREFRFEDEVRRFHEVIETDDKIVRTPPIEEERSVESSSLLQGNADIELNMQELLSGVDPDEASPLKNSEDKKRDGTGGGTFGSALTDVLPSELKSREKLAPLLEGQDLFKKFACSSQMNQKPFDPTEGVAPDQRGYGKRTLKLSPDFAKIEFLGSKKGPELAVPVGELMKVLVPSITHDIIRYQKGAI